MENMYKTQNTQRHLMQKMESPFKYGIDALVARRNSIFGFGWIFHPTLNILQISLLLKFQNGTIQRLPVTYGKHREDVSNAFSNIETAKAAGFLIYGGRKDNNNISAQLEIITADNQIHNLNISLEYLEDSREAKRWANEQNHIYIILLKRFIALFRQGIGLRSLIEKTKRYLTAMPKTINDPQEEIITAIKRSNIKKTVIIIDHDLGGGANKYRNIIVQKYIDNNNAILLLTYHVLSLQYVIELQINNNKTRYVLDNIYSIFELADKIEISEIFYNTAVSFERPETISIILAQLAKAFGIPLTIAVNDYFMICPSQFLLDHRGCYCDLPDIKTCQNCLPQNKEGFVTLFSEADIVLWRNNWSKCLESASKIICFSHSSKSILQRIYPFLTDDYFSIEPHTVPKPSLYPDIDLNKPLHIGIVGHINIHKGAKIVQELANLIKIKKLPIKISIIGTIELSYDSDIVSITGPYQAKDLPNIIQKTGANIFLLPSICPETFSYVTQELITLKVPLISFDIGAQAEKVRQYSKGLVIPYGITNEEILTSIQKFYDKLKQSQ